MRKSSEKNNEKIATTNLVKKDYKKERNPDRLSQNPKNKYPFTLRRT